MSSSAIILTRSCHSVNGKNRNMIKSTGEFSKEELEIIGLKIDSLVKNRGLKFVDIGLKAYPEEGKEAVKQRMKRILRGQVRKFRKAELLRIIAAIGISWDDFLAYEPSKDTGEIMSYITSKLESGQSIAPVLSDIWPEGEKFAKMLADAESMGNDDLAVTIKRHMAESMRKAAAKLMK